MVNMKHNRIRYIVFILLFITIVLSMIFIITYLGGNIFSTNPLQKNSTTQKNNTSITVPIGYITDYYTLNDSEKKKVETIALNDLIVQGYIGAVESREVTAPFSTPDPSFYHVGEIGVTQVHEIAPNVDRSSYLPYVEFILGNESQGDINLYAFVDTNESRTVYVGFINRSGPAVGTYMYLPKTNGVTVFSDVFRGNISNWYMIGHYDNFTIISTGNGSQQPLTKDMESYLTSIVIRNQTVADFLKTESDLGEQYQVIIGRTIQFENYNGAIFAYTTTGASVTPVKSRFGEHTLSIAIDTNNNTIISIRRFPPD